MTHSFQRRIALIIAAVIALLFCSFNIISAQTIQPLEQWTSTTSPYGSPLTSITQRAYGKPFLLTGLTPGLCLKLASNGLATTTTCASGSGLPAAPFTSVQFNDSGIF